MKLDVFEGPLDLLLHLIKKNEIDINNIPVSLITEQYLAYLQVMKALNLDVAGEYLLLAATLIQIKSRLLLPNDNAIDSVGAGETEDDPREELVQQLIEYQKYKEAALTLGQRPLLERDVFMRGQIPHEEPNEEEEIAFKEVSVFELISVFQELIKSVSDEEILEFSGDRFSLIDKISELLEIIKHKKNMTFMELFENEKTKRAIVQTFITVLELVKLRLIKIYQTHNFGVIRIFSLVEEEEE
ncbi:MAG: segregation/condensation protein A [Deltaproteobacteria bacterium]